jgi:DNA-binding IclR family transcriptional regulator
MARDGGRNGVQSVEVAGTILHAMAEAGSALPLKDIARMTGLAPGKVHRYLVSLGNCGLVRQEAESGRYAIGPTAIAAGLAGLRSIDVVRCASEKLAELRDETGETVLIAIWSPRGPVIVELEESSRQIYMNIRAGSILPLLRSAVGRVFAAYLPRDSVLDLLREELPGARDGIPKDIDAMLERTREHGLAMVTGDLVPGVTALAAPLLDHRGRIAAALAILGRSEDLAASTSSEAAVALTSVALLISRQLGYARA